MNQSQNFSAPRRPVQSVQPAGSGANAAGSFASASNPSHQDELHMAGSIASPQRRHLTPQGYAPQITLQQSGLGPSPDPYQSGNSIPNVLQPGGPTARPAPVTANSAPVLPVIPHQEPLLPQLQQHLHQQQQQSQEFRSSPNPPPLAMSSHAYSRSSPTAGGYDSTSNYHPYTPTTPSGSASGPSASQFMSPQEVAKYTAPGSGRNMSHAPLGLADIRPRADSSMSDGAPGSMGYDIQSQQPGTSNYLAPWAIYSFDWCKWNPQGNGAGKVAVGSYLEDGHNFIQILDSQVVQTPQDVYTPGSSKYSLEFNKVAEATHSYPVTRLLWEPPSSQKQSTDLLATSGDHLRLWSLPSESAATPGSNITRRAGEPGSKLTPLALLSNSKTPDHTAPLTSLDWNTVSPSLIITSSIDTTCTIWDIPSLTAKTQLIAHDKEVYDVRFCANSVDVFVSCGQDGSVRMFDLRSLEHSTIIYEPTGKEERVDGGGSARSSPSGQSGAQPPPLLRIATSPHDTHLLATFAQDSGVIRILDVRQPGQALLELRGHTGPINCIEWSPLRRGMLASGGDDCQVLLWDLINSSSAQVPPVNGGQPESSRSPVASWECEYEIGNLGWVPHLQADYGEWLGVSAGRGIWGSRVG